MSPVERTCIGCRRKLPVDRLLRVVRGSDGGIATGNAVGGRGAWLCVGSPSCAERAARHGSFQRALRAPVDRSAVEALVAELRRGAAAGPPGRRAPAMWEDEGAARETGGDLDGD